MRWMRLRLYAPFAAFGGEAIDAHGVTRDFPAQSMLMGLFANALGWSRAMGVEHQALQDRIVYGVVSEQEPALARTTDYQTAQLSKDDRSWTTRGVPVGRAGGPNSYAGAHQRWRDYHADLRVSGWFASTLKTWRRRSMLWPQLWSVPRAHCSSDVSPAFHESDAARARNGDGDTTATAKEIRKRRRNR